MSKHVLIVEDDRCSRETVARILQGSGHIVCAVASAEDARQALTNFTPHLALLDVRLPGIPGDAFAVYLKHKYPSARIVFMSGAFELDEPERFGADVHFISKPFKLETLLQLVADKPAA